MFMGINTQRFFGMNINRSGYVEKRALISFVKQDAAEHGYPCVAISYITDPGMSLATGICIILLGCE